MRYGVDFMIEKIFHASIILWFVIGGRLATAQEAQSAPAVSAPAVSAPTGDSVQIKAAIESYVAAFNARDVEKLVGHWSPQGVYASRTSGAQIVGHDAMREECGTMFKSDGVPNIAVATESIEFISPNVALERGTATVTHPDDDVVESKYSVVYVRRDGSWLIDRVTENEITLEVSNYQQLKDLDWLLGEWVDEGEEFTIEFAAKWTENQNFITRRYTVFAADEVNSSGLQIIGWDPKQKQIRSWLFDSSGTFVTGTWTKRDDRWVVSSAATLADGRSGSFSSIFRPLEDGAYAWQKINRVVDGQLLPHVDEIIVRRK
jgi:uncharacterized protein (TIGR02246 family)